MHKHRMSAKLLELIASRDGETAEAATIGLRNLRKHVIAAVDGFIGRVKSEKPVDPEVVQQTMNFVTFDQERQLSASRSFSFVRYQSYVAIDKQDEVEDDASYRTRVQSSYNKDEPTVMLRTDNLGRSVVELENGLLRREIEQSYDTAQDIKVSLTVTKIAPCETDKTADTQGDDGTAEIATE